MQRSKLGQTMRPITAAALSLLLLGTGTTALAVTPVVKTVPWVASDPLIPHTTWSGKQITLKGTSDVQGANFQYSWDFGDGNAPVIGTVSNMYAVEATHAYTCNVGEVFSARLTIQDTNTGDSASRNYFVECQSQELPAEVNVAIDEGLWYLHKTMTRFVSGAEPCGYWNSGFAGSGYWPNWAVNTNAFFVNGHLQNGSASNPYTETVQRAMCYLPQSLVRVNTGTITFPAPVGGPYIPDGNGNGFALRVNQTSYGYTLGPVIDAFVASGEPNRVTTTGGVDVIGRTYKDLVQDMADWYMASMTYNGTYWGGWDYNGFSSTRNDFSVAQWGAIGLIAAERNFGITIPQWVKDANAHGVRTMQTALGGFGYDSSGYYPWGEWAVDPSGMVQAALDGIGRGDATWDLGESHIRDNFCNTGGAYYAVRDYYYGLFSFTKSMLLHDSDGDAVSEPITLLQSSTTGVDPIDWYAAQVTQGDQCDGVARTLVNDQNAAGYWSGHNYSSAQYSFETAWAIIMLNRTVIISLPVAVAQAIPNPAVAGQTILLDGSESYHKDPSKNIISWEWDLNNDGTFGDASGPTTSTSYPTVGLYDVSLRVCDDGTPQECDETTIVVNVNIPPLAPTADADGPYVFCPQAQPWFLDGTGSVNPDEGMSEPGQPGDTIQEYAWELDGLDNDFNEAFGAQPDVTAFFTAMGVGDYLIQLRVTDTTATSFPSSGYPDLSDTDSSQVSVKDAADPACQCISDMSTYAKSSTTSSMVQLTWTDSGADHYNVYRSGISGGPYVMIGSTTSTYSVYIDYTVAPVTTYYYVVRPAALNGDELCQSNQATVTTPPLRTDVRRR